VSHDPRPFLLILNPTAAGGASTRALDEATRFLDGSGASFRVARSSSPEDVAALARSAISAGEMPVAVGGDGTLACLVREIVGEGVCVGLIPAGRGNDFARVVGIPTDPREAARTLLEGTDVLLDLGEANGKPFLGIASFGFDSDANRIANETKLIRGSLVYVYAAIRALIGWKPAKFEITSPEAPVRRFTGWSVAIANNQAYGGGMFIAPDADLQDGLFDVVTIAGTRKLRFLGAMPRLFKGTHVRDTDVDVARMGEITVTADRSFDVYADGDLLTRLPVTARVLRSSLKIRVPLGAGP
jgi:YegS/Rv2252/BmrU family lipid kinase